MRKLLSTLATLTICALLLSSCRGGCCKGKVVEADSTGIAADSAAQNKEFTGVVLDAAMNSCIILTAAGDTLNFGYPELDRSKIESFMLNDTITVTTAEDTVCSIKKAVAPAVK